MIRAHRIIWSLVVYSSIFCTARLFAAQAKAGGFNDIVRKTEPLSPAEEQKSFHLPPGFEIQLVASEPEINKPINMSFDAAGRLWITNTVEYPHPAKDPEKARDSIKVLSDFDANGKARKITAFAGGLNIPIGVLPYGSGAIGHSIPFIYYFQDIQGTGSSDKRSVLLDRIGFQKDTHGMSGNFLRGFDGWIYATHGFNNDSTVKALDGSEIKMNSGNIYRFRPDGSHIEQYTWGQVNPFGLAFDALGNLYSSDCETKPMYQLLRGGYYPSFGKKDDGLGFAPTMMPYMHGSTAVGGIIIYSDDRFPEEFRNNGFTGNVMTCKINRDLLVDTGTTRLAQLMPDFMTSDDPWFRPVCLKLGPDGAMYVADFYNRIIGHYEVSLTHPGRDRERGRIWRIVYKGTPDKPSVDTLPPDLTRMSSTGLIAAMGRPNLTLRMLAMWRLVDSVGAAAEAPLKMIIQTGNSNQKVCALWALFNVKVLDDAIASTLAADPDPVVRTHVMKVLSEMETWTENQHARALAGLRDKDPWVRRAAADALGRHTSAENIKPLIALRLGADPNDTHLIYTVRMALRNHLLEKGSSEKVRALNLSDNELQTVADVCLGAPSEDSAAILVKYLADGKVEQKDAAKHFEHAVKYLPFKELDAFAATARTCFGGDMRQQLTLLKSIQDGAARRGIALSATVRAWAVETVAKALNAEPDVKETAWTALALDGTPNAKNPWVAQSRVSADGKTDKFLCSFPLGETLTGIYRSESFEVPAKLSFFLAGHNGLPPVVFPPKNFIRLRDSATKELLMEALPPRNDTAQKVQWDLTKYAGKKAFIELVDGDNGTAYAWLAAGRFIPPVVELPEAGSDRTQNKLAAIELSGQMKLDDAGSKIAEIAASKLHAPTLRAASIAALVAIYSQHSSIYDGVHAAILRDESERVALREAAANALGASVYREKKSALIDVLQSAPEKFQTKIALAMCQQTADAENLLRLIGEGKASRRLLLNRAILDRLGALNINAMDDKIAALTKGLPLANEAIQSAIDARITNYRAEKASIETGAKVFEKNCMACHQLEGKGKLVGPNLDGVGARGLERIAEDVLDPSRNVDAAFRLSVVKLASGQVYSGLKRREEGEQVVFADSKGEETSFNKNEIKEMRETQNSLMPDGFAESISADEFNHLMAFLLSKTVKR